MAMDQEVRSEIAVSWWRSKILGVKPELSIEAAVPAELTDADERLRWTVQPILDELVAKLAGTNSAILLADHRAVMLDRRATTPALEAGLDRFAVLPGYDFSEACIGTNAVGTSVEERRRVRIAGAEHYAEILKALSCYGVPLSHPLTRRMIGVLALSFPAHEDHPLMASFIADAGQRIESHLVEWSSQRQRAQFEWFLALGRRSPRPVVSLMNDTVLLNRSACRLDPAHQAELLRAAADLADQSTTSELEVTLSGSGPPVSVRAHTATDEVRFPGVVLEILPPRSRRSHRPPAATALPGLVGDSPAWRAFCSKASPVATTGLPVLVLGEAGVGKLAVVRALHQLAGRSELTIVDVASVVTDGEGTWLQGLRGALQDPDGSVVIRHLELCRPSLAAAIAVEIERSPTSGARLFATFTPGAPHDLGPFLDRFGVRLGVPSLAERRVDIPALVNELLARLGTDPSVRFHPLALAELARAEFPGNIRELEGLVVRLIAKRRKGDILPADFPPLRPAGGGVHLTPMEQAERTLIIETLRAVENNKAAAAATLGISRPTLYRKLRTYRIDATRELRNERGAIHESHR